MEQRFGLAEEVSRSSASKRDLQQCGVAMFVKLFFCISNRRLRILGSGGQRKRAECTKCKTERRRLHETSLGGRDLAVAVER